MRLGTAVAVVSPLVLVLGGCTAPHAAPAATATPPPAPVASTPSTPEPAPAAPPVAMPPQAAANRTMAFSACAFRGGVMSHRIEWAAPLLPAGYRQVNQFGATNLGESSLLLLHCKGVAGGNSTYVADATFGYYGILVAPPADRQGTGGNFYVLDFLAAEPTLLQSLQAAAAPALAAAIVLGDGSESVDAGSAFQAQVDGAAASPDETNDTFQSRLHWVAGGLACWADLTEYARGHEQWPAVLSGQSGPPYVVSGPGHRLAGLVGHGDEDAQLSPPVCVPA